MREYINRNIFGKGSVFLLLVIKFLSETRKGLDNPNVQPIKKGSLVCFKDGEPVRMFKYGFEINNFIGSDHAGSNIVKTLGIAKFPYGYEWKSLMSAQKKYKI